MTRHQGCSLWKMMSLGENYKGQNGAKNGCATTLELLFEKKNPAKNT